MRLWEIAILAALLPACSAFLSAQDKKAPDEQPHTVGNGVAGPSVISKIEPGYTEEARAAKVEGSVVLRVVVGADGRAHDISVVKSLDSGLDAKAIEAVRQWRFKPGTLNGNPVSVIAQIQVIFKLL